MTQFSQLQNKPVLERESSNIVGRIKNAYFSQGCKRIVYLVMNNCKNGEETLIPFDDVLSFKDAIVVQNSVNFKSAQDIDFTAFTTGLMDMPIYTQAGILKGNVSEIEFFQSGKVSKICTETEQFSPTSILSAGNAIILKGAPKTPKAKPAKIPRPSIETLAVIETDNLSVHNDTAKANMTRDIFVGAQNDNSDGTANDTQADTQIAKTATEVKTDYIMQNAILHTAPPAVFVSGNSPLFTKDAFDAIVGEESEYEDTHTPTRVICDYEFLLGRVLGQDLYTYTNVPIAQKGDIVTDELVRKARLAGKLVELTLNSIKME